MPLQSAIVTPHEALTRIRATANNTRVEAEGVLDTTQLSSIDTNGVFRALDQFAFYIASLTSLKATPGLDAYATAQGYSGSLVADCTASTAAAQNCIGWVVTNFPTGAGGFLLAETLNADGSRTLRMFTPAQTAGWRTVLQAFIDTIS